MNAIRETLIARARPILQGLVSIFSLMFFAALAFQFASPQLSFTLTPEIIHPVRGHSHAVVLPQPWGFPLLRTVGDTFDARYSRLVLSEDGRPLLFPHASTPAIDQVGGGRYVHLRDNELYLSTSDNSNPRANGRRYSVEVPITPMRGLTTTLFTLALATFVGAAALRSAPVARPPPAGPGALWPWACAAAAFAAVWQLLILTDTPRIIASGDGGVVAGIAAAGLYPERLAGDLVYGQRANFDFYWTLTIPATRWLTALTGDVGTSFGLLMGPMLLAQMLGFLLLGRRLLGRNDLAAALALMSVAPVYVIDGELWGSLSEPITRYAYNALFPYLLLVALRPRQRIMPYLVMGLCGLGVYLHPVSALGVAMALWFAMALTKSDHASWMRHGRDMFLAGLLFVVLAAPFAISFAQAFPNDPGDTPSSMARELIRQSTGEQYHNVLRALARFGFYTIRTQAGKFGWLWLALIGAGVALILMSRYIKAAAARDLRFLGLVMLGVLLASAGVTAFDQAIAAARGVSPLQIDLIRNIRFLVPLTLVIVLFALSKLSNQGVGAPLWRATSLAFIALWLTGNPSLPLDRALAALEGRRTLRDDDVGGRSALRHMAQVPIAGAVLVLPATVPTSESEMVALAIRYGGRHPAYFLQKDLNLLSYSGSRAVSEWRLRRDLVRALEEAATQEAFAVTLGRLRERQPVSFVLARTDTITTAHRAWMAARGIQTGPGPWVFYRVE